MDAGRLLTVTPLVFLCFLGAHAGTHGKFKVIQNPRAFQARSSL